MTHHTPAPARPPPPDFFTTAIHARFEALIAVMAAVYASAFLGWAVVYYITFLWAGVGL